MNEGKAELFKGISRMGMVTGIKPDKIEYYKQLHAKAWPGVLKKLKEVNIQNYSIYIFRKLGKNISCSVILNIPALILTRI